MRIPFNNPRKFTPWVQDLVERCRASASSRTMIYRNLKQWRYSGSGDNTVALYNRLNTHIERLGSYLFSPADLRFFVEFETHQEEDTNKQGDIAAHYLTRKIEGRDIDLRIGGAVDTGIHYGCSLMKMGWGSNGLKGSIISPWAFGVLREDINDVEEQEAMCESNPITLDELWRRVGHRPDGGEIMKRARAAAKRRSQDMTADSYFHQVLLASQPPAVQTTAGAPAQPGGLVNITSDPIGGLMSPQVMVNMVMLHELTVLDDELGDYVTIQYVEPDIIIEPYLKKRNLFLPQEQPYVVVCPNRIEGAFWGRSELADLVALQAWLAMRCNDVKKMMNQEYDGRYVFQGMTGDAAELYDSLQNSGFASVQDQGKVEDLTRPLPANAFQELNEIIQWMNDVSGFNNILNGQGEGGVRSGNHADTLVRTSSPRLRDRAILVERAIGRIGDKALDILAAKDASQLFLDPKDTEKSGFLLSTLPDERRVVVDSHSSSPIYEQDHMQLAFALRKAGAIDSASLIDLTNLPMKDILKQRLRDAEEKQAQQQQQMLALAQKNPELIPLISGKGGHAAGGHGGH